MKRWTLAKTHASRIERTRRESYGKLLHFWIFSKTSPISLIGQSLDHKYFLNISWYNFALMAISFGICAAIILLNSRLPSLRMRDNDLNAEQSTHTRPTPRVGGIAFFFAFGLGVIFAPAPIAPYYAKFILATFLIFLVGLCEDLGFRISPRGRLLAMAGSSLLVIWLLGVWIPKVAGVPGIDGFVQYWAIGIPLTIFITAGISNGFNLIDV